MAFNIIAVPSEKSIEEWVNNICDSFARNFGLLDNGIIIFKTGLYDAICKQSNLATHQYHSTFCDVCDALKTLSETSVNKESIQRILYRLEDFNNPNSDLSKGFCDPKGSDLQRFPIHHIQWEDYGIYEGSDMANFIVDLIDLAQPKY